MALTRRRWRRRQRCCVARERWWFAGRIKRLTADDAGHDRAVAVAVVQAAGARLPGEVVAAGIQPRKARVRGYTSIDDTNGHSGPGREPPRLLDVEHLKSGGGQLDIRPAYSGRADTPRRLFHYLLRARRARRRQRRRVNPRRVHFSSGRGCRPERHGSGHRGRNSHYSCETPHHQCSPCVRKKPKMFNTHAASNGRSTISR